MSWYSLYRRADGVFTGRRMRSTDPEAVKLNTPIDCDAIEGRYDRFTQRVDLVTGEVITDELLGDERDRERRRDTTRQQIAELEQRQARPLRELARDPRNATARLKIDEIDIAIRKLREQLKD